MASGDSPSFRHGIVDDVVDQNKATYVASLESAVSTASIISSMLQQVDGTGSQLEEFESLRALGACIDALLVTLNTDYRPRQLSESISALEDLNMYVNESGSLPSSGH